jgi:hypothetical protein
LTWWCTRCGVLAEAFGDFGAGVRLGELTQHLDRLWLEQRFGPLDAFEEQYVAHCQEHPVRKANACQYRGMSAPGLRLVGLYLVWARRSGRRCFGPA